MLGLERRELAPMRASACSNPECAVSASFVMHVLLMLRTWPHVKPHSVSCTWRPCYRKNCRSFKLHSEAYMFENERNTPGSLS